MDKYKPAIAMLMLQITYAGNALFTRIAFVGGLSPMVFVVYRQAIATLFISPFSFISLWRKPSKPSLGIRGLGWIAVTSVIGVTVNQNAYFEGLYLSSSYMASAMTNLIPGVTFVITTLIGLEKIKLRSMRSIAKVVGTAICVGGAMVMTFLKGPQLLNHEFVTPHNLLGSNGDTWFIGCLFLLLSTLSWSLWLILQVPITSNCSDHLYTSSWMCFMATVSSATVAVVFGNRDLESWKLDSFLKLSCCLYSGIALAVSFFVQAWCVSKRGPLFSALFNPLCTVLVTFFGGLCLQEEIFLGSLLGAVAVIVGLYVVLWGKAEDYRETDPKLADEDTTTTCDCDYVPVLIDDHNLLPSDLLEPLVSHE